MSGISELSRCPACGGGNNHVYSDWKPFEYVVGHCLDCGFFLEPKTGQVSLEELNEQRKEAEMEPLQKLPKVDFRRVW